MRIAVFADVHANLVALQTIVEHIEAWRPDIVIAAGDIINRGPRPAECLALVQGKQRAAGWLTIRGNHEDYVLTQASLDAPRAGPAADVHQPSIWTLNKLGTGVSSLEEMPFQQDISDPDNRLVRIVHASMLGNRVGIYPETTDEELASKIGVCPEQAGCSDQQLPVLFCVGHTHRPLIRVLNGILVVNAGSAGLSFDGDHRAAYAQLTYRRGVWQAKIIRISFDLHASEQDFYNSGYLTEAGPIIRLVLFELQHARSMLYGWAMRYQERALAGEISVEQSVHEYLTRLSG